MNLHRLYTAVRYPPIMTITTDFGRALGLQLRRPVTFRVGEGGRPERWRTLCADGPAWLKSDLGGRLELQHTDRGLSAGSRSGPPDLFLDALALALGSSPGDDRESWTASLDARLLPGPHWLTFLKPHTESTFHRRREGDRWIQTAAHRGPWGVVMTRAEIDEAGLQHLELQCDGRRRLAALHIPSKFSGYAV